MENTMLLQDQVITITITMITKMITKLITKMITTKAGQEFQPVNISKVTITVAPMEIKIMITVMLSAVMAVAAGTAPNNNNNLCNLMITTPLLVLITLISIIMILIDIMRACIRGADKNPIARDMAIWMMKVIP